MYYVTSVKLLSLASTTLKVSHMVRAIEMGQPK